MHNIMAIQVQGLSPGPLPPLAHGVGFLTLDPKLDPCFLRVDLKLSPLSKIADFAPFPIYQGRMQDFCFSKNYGH